MAELKTPNDLVRELQLARGNPSKSDWGRAVFLIGAGCSRSAGIPLGGEIARHCVKKLAHVYSDGEQTFATTEEFVPKDAKTGEDEALRALGWLASNVESFKPYKGQPPNWGALYGDIFENHLKAPGQQRDVVAKAVKCGEGRVNWAHLCLGELVHRAYIHTVLTTNFDQLVLQGVLRTGLLPVVVDGIESLNRVSSRPALPQVIHLHGSMHTYNPRNSSRAVLETKDDPALQGTLFPLLQGADLLVVMGYAGGEEGVMHLFIEAAKRLPEAVIYWALHGQNLNAESPQVQELLRTGHNKFFMPDCDADRFFASIMAGLGIGVPHWIHDPVHQLELAATTIADNTDSDIQKQIAAHRESVRSLREHVEAKPVSPETEVAAITALRLQGEHQEALELLRVSKNRDEPELLKMQADSAYELGKITLHPDLLEESIRCWKALLTKISMDKQPEEWARANCNLGDALWALGAREDDTTRLEEAGAAYKAALQVYAREQFPLDWGMAQNNLGTVLATLGKREEGTSRLEEAVAAFRSALEVRTREQFPVNWAMTQNNVGAVLQILGQREKRAARLEEAVAAFRSALEVRTREQFPVNWATTQNNLGNALSALGECEDSVARLEEAVSAYKAALDVCTREHFPVDWAMTQNNIGTVLAMLGRREDGTAWLEKAAVAFRAALEVRTRESLPISWATTQNNLANVLVRLGEREEGTARLEEAVTAYRVALDVFIQARAGYYITQTKQNLERAEKILLARKEKSQSTS